MNLQCTTTVLRQQRSSPTFFFDDETAQSINILATIREELVWAKLRKLEKEESIQDMEQQQNRIDLTLFKIQRLKEVKEQFPSMTDEEILTLFPGLIDVITHIQNDHN